MFSFIIAHSPHFIIILWIRHLIKAGGDCGRLIWKKLTSRKSEDTIPALKINDSLVTDPARVKEEVALYFEKLGSLGEEEPPGLSDTGATPDICKTSVDPFSISPTPSVSPHDTFADPITYEEVQLAIGKTKLRTAMGGDNIPAAFLREGGGVLSEALVRLFNLVLSEEQVPMSWTSEKTRLLHKGGSKLDLDNYRGITVASNVMKVFTRIWGARLERCVEDSGMLGEMQGGFRKGRSTSEQAFILSTLMEKSNKTRKKMCIAFVDLRKAYDTVKRDKLWEVLQEVGFGRKFISIVQGLYQGHRKTVMVGSEPTRPIVCARGLKQGCVLSPMLFAIFIEKLSSQLLQMGEGIQLGDVSIPALFFADDIALFAASEEALQRKLDLVYKFMTERGLEINFRKTKIMRVGPGSNVERVWGVRGLGEEAMHTVEETKAYRYLGILFGSARRFLQHRKKKLEMLPRAIGLLKDKARDTPVRKRATDLMWRQQVREALLAGADVVDYPQQWIREADIHQNKVGRWILGVGPRTSPDAVRAELGWESIENEIFKRKCKFYEHLMYLPDTRWVKQAFREVLSSQTSSDWLKGVMKARAGLIPFIPTRHGQRVQSSWKRMVFQAARAKRQTEWLAVRQANKILASHPIDVIVRPSHLVWENSKLSRSMLRLRLGDVGSWKDWISGICPACGDKIEGCLRDHVVLDCVACTKYRQQGDLGRTLDQVRRLQRSREVSIQTVLGGLHPERWKDLSSLLSQWEELRVEF